MACILVLGTPRSGTSCVAGILHHLGVPMGEELMPPDEWNPAGYFQDREFELILADGLGVFTFPPWSDVDSLPRSRKFNNCKKTLRQTATAIKNLADSREGLWGVKSNRLAYLLDAMPADMKVIRTFRPEVDSIASWAARARTTIEASTPIIRNMNLAIDASLQKANITPYIADYNAILSDPAAGVAGIASFVGLPVTQAAIDFVNADFRRFANGE